MRSIRHPGPSAPERVLAVPCVVERRQLTLCAGYSLDASVAQAFAGAGAKGGYLRLRQATVSPMRYVMPAASPDESHAAWYSETFAPEGACTVEDAGLVCGWRDGEPFLHCHGLWRTPDGERRMGHLLPLESELVDDVEAEAWLVSGATFNVQDDEETNFRLFRPIASGEARGGDRGLLCTVRPNQEIGAAIEAVCRDHGIAEADVYGIGSLIGAAFDDARALGSYATEVLVRNGRLAGGRCTLDIALVGMDGAIGEGQLTHDSNPVCVTFELLIVERL